MKKIIFFFNREIQLKVLQMIYRLYNAEFPHDGLFDKVFLFTFIVIGSTDQLRQSDLIIDAMSITTCVS